MGQRIVGKYYKMPPQERINQLIDDYDCFPDMIDVYERDIYEWILGGISKARQDAIGDLGVRIQNGNNVASPTASVAEIKQRTDAAMKMGFLDASFKDLIDFDEINRGMREIALMKREFGRFSDRLKLIHKGNRTFFELYLKKHKNRTRDELATELEMTRDALDKRIYRLRKDLCSGFLETLNYYDDASIIYFI